MMFDFENDPELSNLQKYCVTFEGTATAEGVPDLQQAEFALFHVEGRGYTWAVWNPLKRMWEDYGGFWHGSVKSAVNLLQQDFPEARFTFRLHSMNREGSPAWQIPDLLAEYEGRR